MFGGIARMHMLDVILQLACPALQPVGTTPGSRNDFLIEPFVVGQCCGKGVAQKRTDLAEFREIIIQLNQFIYQRWLLIADICLLGRLCRFI